MIDTIISVGKNLFSIFSEAKKLERDKKDRLKLFFTDVANLLDNTAGEIAKDSYPYGNCSQMAYIADSLPEVLDGVVDEKKSIEFSDILAQASNIELLYNQRNELPVVEKLKEAAGIFRAIAMTQLL